MTTIYLISYTCFLLFLCSFILSLILQYFIFSYKIKLVFNEVFILLLMFFISFLFLLQNYFNVYIHLGLY